MGTVRFWRRLGLIGMLGGLVLLAACGGSAEPERSAELHGATRTPPLEVGAVTLPDVAESEPGPSFPMRAPDGGVLLVYFGYTHCPDLCPATFADIRIVREDLGRQADRVATAFVTIDPDRDTAAVMRDYLAHFLPSFHALRTSDPGALAQAQQAFAASSRRVDEGDGEYSMEHTASIYAVDDGGKVVVEWPFGTEPETLAADLRVLLDRAQANEGSDEKRSTT